jgi:hypothetical protein
MQNARLRIHLTIEEEWFVWNWRKLFFDLNLGTRSTGAKVGCPWGRWKAYRSDQVREWGDCFLLEIHSGKSITKSGLSVRLCNSSIPLLWSCCSFNSGEGVMELTPLWYMVAVTKASGRRHLCCCCSPTPICRCYCCHTTQQTKLRHRHHYYSNTQSPKLFFLSFFLSFTERQTDREKKHTSFNDHKN